MADHIPHLSTLEAQAAAQVLQALRPLTADQVERVLAHVQAQLDEQHDVRPLFARSITSPLGKQDHPLKTKVDELTHTLWLQRMRMLQTDTSTVFRDFVYFDVHGRTWSDMVLDKLNHDAECARARARLLGPSRVPEFSVGASHG